jgi:aminoglycoside phosphotransferase (APT) family kinase protein
MAIEVQNNLPPENPGAAAAFVQDVLGTDCFELEAFPNQGYMSRTYSCDTSDRSFILRHGTDYKGMAKDRFVGDCFSEVLPVPAVVGLRRVEDRSAMCLSVRLDGEVADRESLGRQGTPLNASFAQALQALHSVDLSGCRGWGFAGANGRGPFPKWLFAMGAQNRVGEIYFGRLARRETDIDRTSFRDILAMQRSLGKAATGVDERRLCHGDLKSGNILADGDQVTGIIDWARFSYADPAYDLGMLHVRYPGAIDYQAHCEAIGVRQDNLDERVRYHAIGECTVAIWFFGKIGNEAKKAEAERRLLQIANEAETNN